MVMRLVAIVLIAVAVIGVFGNISPQGNLASTFENIQTSVTTVAYAGELEEIKTAVNEFMYLRTILGTDDAKILSEKLDNRLNSLELVKIYCNKEISTLDLAHERDPYVKIQEICPKLDELSLSKAAQLFRMI